MDQFRINFGSTFTGSSSNFSSTRLHYPISVRPILLQFQDSIRILFQIQFFIQFKSSILYQNLTYHSRIKSWILYPFTLSVLSFRFYMRYFYHRSYITGDPFSTYDLHILYIEHRTIS